MAINLATKYSDKIQSKFTSGSYLAGKLSNNYEFNGVKTVTIFTPKTVEENNYSRTASQNRYGTPTEMQDTVQELTMSQDKSFSLTIDKGNNSEQMLTKEAGKMLKLQLDERTIPAADTYAFGVFKTNAGIHRAASAALTKSTVATEVSAVAALLDEAEVPYDNRYLYVNPTIYGLIRLSTEWTSADTLAVSGVEKGVVGEFLGMKVVKVPVSRLGDGVNFMIIHKDSALMPYKIKDTKIHNDAPGISGALLEGRHMYDAFVLAEKSSGVAVDLTNSCTVCVTPTISISSGTVTVTGTSGDSFKYTTDGSDPRYSKTATAYDSSSKPVIDSGTVVRAYAYKANCYNSGAAQQKYTA